MTKKNKLVRAVIIIVPLLLCISICCSFTKTKQVKEAAWSEFKPVLDPGEIILEAVSDHALTYAITSKAGNRNYGDTLAVFEREEDGNFENIYENDFRKLKPWKIELADIDGDNQTEILTAVRKKTHFDQTEKNRMFIFNYRQGKLTKKWTGSKIAGDWENFAAGDLVSIKGDELTFIRKTETGKRVSVYYWYNFGFLLLAESEDYPDIREINRLGENRIFLTCKERGKKRTIILKAENDRLVETKE
jgi:hypothetical protein